MKLNVFSVITSLGYATSLSYFAYVNFNVYDLEAEVDYFYAVFPSLVVLALLSLFVALVVWLFRRKAYFQTFQMALGIISIMGIAVNSLAIYLMYWSVGQ